LILAGEKKLRQPSCLARIRKNRRWLVGAVLGAFALIGVITSVLATHVHYETVASEGGYRSFCTLSDKIDCTAVVLTPQSRLLGIPISIFGIFTYLIVLGLQVRGPWRGDLEFARSLALTVLIGFGCTLYSVYLGYIVVFLVQRHCLVCYGLYAVNLSLLVFGLLLAWRWRVSVIGMLAWEVQSILENRVVAIGTGLLLIFCVIGAFVMRNVQRNLLIHRNPVLLAVFDGSAERRLLNLKNVPTWGPEDAPVTVIEFNDFQCPFCRQSVKTLEQVLERFPEQIRRQFMNLPLDRHCNAFIPWSMHEGSCRLARAGRAAYLVGKFWEFHRRAFGHVGVWSDEAIASLLIDLGIPEDEIAGRMMDIAVQISIENDVRLAHRLGIARTPSFIVNGMLLEGNFDPWLWERVIKLEIERAQEQQKRAKPTSTPIEPLGPAKILAATDFL
jgi:protein-disulfide isomerase/uncharacterized membrane protein